MILTSAVVIALVASIILEGRTITVCLRAAAPAGATRLTALGSTFLASEVWVVALLGLAHGAYAGLMHVLMAAGAMGAIAYFAGWMLRDLCLWLGPRLHAAGFARWGVTLGATLQLVGIVIFVVAALRVLPEAMAATTAPVGGTLLAILVIPVLVLGGVLQVQLYRLPRAAYFNWEPRSDPYAV